LGAPRPVGPKSGVDQRTTLKPDDNLTHEAHDGGAVNEHPMPLPTQEECKPLEPGEERVIALAIDKSTGIEKFKIGAARANWEELTPPQWNAPCR
jgi:hypothetical protein